MKKILFAIMLPAGMYMTGGCTQADIREAVAQSNDQGMNKEIVAGGIRYMFKYRSGKAMAAAASYNKQEEKVDEKRYRQELKDKEDAQYIIITHEPEKEKTPVLRLNAGSYEVYNQRVNYYTFHAMEDIRLVCGADTIRPVGYHYENNMEITPYNSMIFVFPKCGNDANEVKVVFNDIPFENYLIKAKFNIR